MQDTKLPQSFTGHGGQFYVLCPEGLNNPTVPKKYALYQSTETYNCRSEIPVYVPADQAIVDFNQVVHIHPETLNTNWPVDHDEVDLGLTRSVWKERFNQARQLHAA